MWNAVIIMFFRKKKSKVSLEDQKKVFLDASDSFVTEGKYEDAILCFDEALKLDPMDTTTWQLKGIVSTFMEDYEQAVECFGHALELNPTFKMWKCQTHFLNKLGRFPEALKCSEEALKLDPENSQMLFERGYTLIRLKKCQEGLDFYDKALKQNPKYVKVLYFKGFALIQTEKYDEALECFEKALDLNPETGHAWSGKGLALEKLGKSKEALKSYKKALQINPNSQISKKGIENIQPAKT